MKDSEARKEIATLRSDIRHLEHLLSKESLAREELTLQVQNHLLRSKTEREKSARDWKALLEHLEIELVLEPSKVVVYDVSEEEEEEEEESAGHEPTPGGGRGKTKK